MEVIDAHVHFVGPPGAPLAWHDPHDALLNRQRLPGELRAGAEQLGVAGAVMIEADARGDLVQPMLALGAHDPYVRGVVVNLQPGLPGFVDRLARASANPLFRGIRVGTPWAPIELENDEFLADLEAVAELGYALDTVTVGGGGLALLEALVALTARLPDLRIIIDHLPFAVGDAPAAAEAYRRNLRTLGANPRVWAKLSNLLPRTGPVPDDPGHYQPVVDELLTMFGTERLVYGSNWPVSLRVAPYERAFEILQVCVGRAGADVKEKFFCTNARTVYGLST